MAAIMLLTMAARAESPEEQERQPRGYLALTFDDGPSGALTERLLDGLQVHTDLTKLSPQEVQQDMAETAGKIHSLTGISPRVMRPPGGAYNEAVCREAAREGMSVILWSVDPRDWAIHDAGAVLHTMAHSAEDGDIILMHDLSESSVEAALQLVELLEEEGYCFVTVSELAALRGQTMTPGNVYTNFREK